MIVHSLKQEQEKGKVDLGEGLWVVRERVDDSDCVVGNLTLQRATLVR